MPKTGSRPPVDEIDPAPCAICHTMPWVGNIPPAFNLWQVSCPSKRHRTRLYPDQRSAVMAWNTNQRHKRDQRKPHG